MIEEAVQMSISEGRLPEGIGEQLEETVMSQPLENSIRDALVFFWKSIVNFSGDHNMQRLTALAACAVLIKVFEIKAGDMRRLKEEVATLQRTIAMMELP